MSTLFQEIYDSYKIMAKDCDLLSLDIQDQNEILDGWLETTIKEFSSCKQSLERDKTLKQFNNDLFDDVKLVLAKGILTQWVKPQFYNIDNLRNYVSTKDFNMFSPSAILKEIKDTYIITKKDFDDEIAKYKNKNFDPSKELRR